jgi:alkylhydroperoxidase family enzyme
MAVREAPDEVDETLVCSLERPQEATDLSDRERAALGFADLFATNHLAIDDSVYDGLREHFDEGELVELGITCAYFFGFGRLTATWHLVEYLPDRFREVPNGQPITPW